MDTLALPQPRMANRQTIHAKTLRTRNSKWVIPDNVKDTLWLFLVVGVTLGVVSMVTISSGGTSGYVCASPLLFQEEAKIVSKELISGVCTDYLGVERADLESWTSSSDSCDLVTCYVEPSGNYTVAQSCRPREPYENPDTVNCQWVSNDTSPYPGCCPVLECGTSATLSTVDPLLCYDLASTFACGFWYNISSGCNDTAAFVYNISQTYCRNTCGLC